MDGAPRPPVRVVAPIALALVVLLVLAVRGHVRRAEVERRAGAVASAIAGRHVEVDCPGPIRRRLFYEINEGSVMFSADGTPVDETKLSGRVCDGLRRVLDQGAALDLSCLVWHGSARDEQAAEGLAVLTHEAVHLRGVIDEGQTECEAVRRVAGTARALGLTEASAHAVQAWQGTDWAQRLPDRYRSCPANAS